MTRQPAWRTDRDLLYLGLEAQAQAYHAQATTKQQETAAFEAALARGRAALQGQPLRA